MELRRIVKKNKGWSGSRKEREERKKGKVKLKVRIKKWKRKVKNYKTRKKKENGSEEIEERKKIGRIKTLTNWRRNK